MAILKGRGILTQKRKQHIANIFFLIGKHVPVTYNSVLVTAGKVMLPEPGLDLQRFSFVFPPDLSSPSTTETGSAAPFASPRTSTSTPVG